MVEKEEKPEQGRSLLAGIITHILEVLSSLKLLAGEIKDHWDDQVEGFLRRVERLFILYLWISIGALFMVLGSFDFLIEYGKVPRPWVYSVGGLVILLVAVIVLQSTRLGKGRR